MKTLMNQTLSRPRDLGLRWLEWGNGAAGRIEKQRETPRLRIVRPDEELLFRHASTIQAANGFWETIVYGGLAVSALAALMMAFW